jgi:hypothetical protein
MLTPEGKVKNEVKKILAGHKPALYALWLVQNGMGSPTLDCLGCYKGYAFAIETKAPGKKPTPRQQVTVAQMEATGCAVFVIDGSDSSLELTRWLEAVKLGLL